MARVRRGDDAATARIREYRDGVRVAMSGANPEDALVALLDGAYRAGMASSTPAPKASRGPREIRVDMLRQRTRDAFETLRVLSGAKLRETMEPLVLVEEEDVVGSLRVNLVSPAGWRDHSWGRSILAPLRDLGVIVPVAEGEPTLTLSRRGVDLMLRDVTTTDVPATPAWEIQAPGTAPRPH